MNEQVEKEWPADMIKKLRTRPSAHQIQLKMRQVDLAEQVGVDPRTVQQWENGDRTPGSSSLKRLIQVFLQAGKLVVDAEMNEAKALWDAVKQMAEARSLSGREFASFDETWFAQLLEAYKHNEANSTRALLEDETRVPQPTPILASTNPAPSRGNLPERSTLFIGRAIQTQDIQSLLEKGSIVSIIGTGGIGKTALAIHAAHQIRAQYPDGIWVLELATLQDAHLLNHYVLSVLGLQHQPGRSEWEIVLEHIRDKQLLFIFDNCEHLIDAVAALIERLIAANRQLHLMVTSRESLNIAAEQVYRLPPLTLPEADSTAEQGDVSESVQLFVARLQALHPQHQPTAQELQGIESICQRLEGIPLAIELAAARLNILSIDQIQERLVHLLTFLTGGQRTAAPRQQTLKATIDWSYSLLDRKEQLLLQALSVFAHRFTLDAVEQIVASSEHEENAEQLLSQTEMIDLLSGLVNKSLVMLERQQENGAVRYRMLETIREYAQHQLQHEASPVYIQHIYKAHSAYYDQWMKQQALLFRTSKRDQCLQQTRLEYSNLSLAMQRAYQGVVSQGSGIRIASSLYWFWLHEGMGIEGLLWLDRFLEVAHAEMSIPLQSYDQKALATAYHGRGVIQFVLARLSEAEQSVEQSMSLSRREQYDSLRAASLRLISFIRLHQGKLEQAIIHAEESIQLARQHEDAWNLASSLHALGRLKLRLGEVEQGTLQLKESIHWFEQAGDRWELSGPYESLGYAALQAGQFQESINYFKKSISISQIYKGTWVLIRSLDGMIAALHAIGRYREAAILIHAAERHRQQEQMVSEGVAGIDMKQIQRNVNKQLTTKEQQEIERQAEQLSREQLLAYSLEL